MGCNSSKAFDEKNKKTSYCQGAPRSGGGILGTPYVYTDGGASTDYTYTDCGAGWIGGGGWGGGCDGGGGGSGGGGGGDGGGGGGGGGGC